MREDSCRCTNQILARQTSQEVDVRAAGGGENSVYESIKLERNMSGGGGRIGIMIFAVRLSCNVPVARRRADGHVVLEK